MLQRLRLAYPARPISIAHVSAREMASGRNQDQRKVHAKQNLQHQVHVLAHVADVVPVGVADRMGSVGLLRRDGRQRKPGDRPAKRSNPGKPSEPS